MLWVILELNMELKYLNFELFKKNIKDIKIHVNAHKSIVDVCTACFTAVSVLGFTSVCVCVMDSQCLVDIQHHSGFSVQGEASRRQTLMQYSRFKWGQERVQKREDKQDTA